MSATRTELYEKAIAYLQRCLAVSVPTESHLRKAFALLVSAFAQANRHDEAWTVCRQGLSLYPDDKELHFRGAMLLHQFGKLEDAVQAYQRVLNDGEAMHFSSREIGLAGFKARHNLAVVYDEMGQLDNAEFEWRRIIGEVPNYHLGWRALGEILLRQGKFDEAERVCASLGSLPLSKGGPGGVARPANQLEQRDLAKLASEALILRGRLAAARGDFKRAINDLRAADQSNPNDLEPLRLVCRLLFEQGEPRDAEAALRELTDRAPDDASAHYNLGTIRQRLRRHAEAALAFRDSLKLRPNSPATHLQLGYALQDSGAKEDAAQSWKTVLKLDPGNTEARIALTSI